MKTCCSLLAVALASTAACGVPLPLDKDAGGVVFGTEALKVRFDRETGWPADWIVDGVRVISADPEFKMPISMRCSVPPASTNCALRSMGVERVSDDTVRSRMEAKPWRYALYVQLLPGKRMARRWLEFEWLDESPGTVLNIWMLTGKMRWEDGKGAYFHPGTFPPARHVRTASSPDRHYCGIGAASPTVAEDCAGCSVLHCIDELQPYSDRGLTWVTERGDGFTLSTRFAAAGRVFRGKPQTVGDMWLRFGRGTAEDQLLTMHDWHRTVGQVPPADRPEWMKDLVLYSCHPTGTSEDGYPCRLGFKGMQQYIPYVKNLGATAIWLRPVEHVSQYIPDEMYRLADFVGTEADHLEYVRAAHRAGLKVWRDAVMHGGKISNRRSQEHPEWVCRKEDGSPQDLYWAYDFYWPTWVKYFSDWVEWTTRKFELDGWRMDVPTGARFPNWNPDIPYPRASYAQNQGGIAQMRAIRAATKRVNPDSCTLAESNMSTHGVLCDAIYDQHSCHAHFHDFRTRPAADVVRDYRRWLHEQHYSFVPGIYIMRYPCSHDSIPTLAAFGPTSNALMALCSWIQGFPLVYASDETVFYEAWRKIFRIRHALPELSTDAGVDYLGVDVPDGVFACRRFKDGAESVVLVNFNERRVKGTAKLVGGASVPFDLPAFGYDVIRVKGRSVAEMLGPEPPPVAGESHALPDASLPFVAELRDFTNGTVAAGWKISKKKTDRGWHLSVEDFGGLDPKSVQLVVRLPQSERWFVHAAEGSFVNPCHVWRPDFERSRGSVFSQLRYGAVRFDSLMNPLGFTPEHAAAGGVAGDTAFRLTGFPSHAVVRVWDRVGAEAGLAVSVGTREGAQCRVPLEADVEVLPAAEALAEREPGTGDPRLTPMSGGWLYESGDLRMRIRKNGAIVGMWKRQDGAWRPVARLVGFWSHTEKPGHKDWTRHDPEERAQENEFGVEVDFSRSSDGTLVLDFTGGRLRNFGKRRWAESSVSFKTTFTLGDAPDGFGYKTLFSMLNPLKSADLPLEWRFEPATAVEGRAIGSKGMELRLSRSLGVNFDDIRWIGYAPGKTVFRGGRLACVWQEKGMDLFRSPRNWVHGFECRVKVGPQADYMVIDCRPPYGANGYASADDLPYGGLTNRVYARDLLVMRRIPAGGRKFRMGNDLAEAKAMTGDADRQMRYYTNALPHDVSFDSDFWMSVYPLTQRQSALLTGHNNMSSCAGPETAEPWRSGYGEPDERPLESVSWEDLVGNAAGEGASERSVLGVIRARTGWAFELPTDAQWEFACRAGTKGPWYFKPAEDGTTASYDAHGWFGWMSRKRYPGDRRNWGAPHPVGLLKPNAWGLYDMHGNVWEWCRDRFSPGSETRVVRGGCHSNGPADCRSAFRYFMKPDSRNNSIGVRLVLPAASD